MELVEVTARVDVAEVRVLLRTALLGATLAVRALFETVHVSVTVPLKFPTRDSVRVELFVFPTIRTSVGGVDWILKPDFATETVSCTVWTRLPLVPVKLTV